MSKQLERLRRREVRRKARQEAREARRQERENAPAIRDTDLQVAYFALSLQTIRHNLKMARFAFRRGYHKDNPEKLKAVHEELDAYLKTLDDIRIDQFARKLQAQNEERLADG